MIACSQPIEKKSLPPLQRHGPFLPRRRVVGTFSTLICPGIRPPRDQSVFVSAAAGVRCCERPSVHSCSCHQSPPLQIRHCYHLPLPPLNTATAPFVHFVLFLSGLEHLLIERGVLFYVILSFPFLSFISIF